MGAASHEKFLRNWLEDHRRYRAREQTETLVAIKQLRETGSSKAEIIALDIGSVRKHVRQQP